MAFNIAQHASQFGGEARGRIITHEHGNTAQALFIRWDGVGLRVFDHLQTMLDAAQKAIGLAHRLGGLDGDVPRSRERRERLAGAGDA